LFDPICGFKYVSMNCGNFRHDLVNLFGRDFVDRVTG